MPISVEQAYYSTYYYEEKKIDDREYDNDEISAEYQANETEDSSENKEYNSQRLELEESEKGQNLDVEV